MILRVKRHVVLNGVGDGEIEDIASLAVTCDAVVALTLEPVASRLDRAAEGLDVHEVRERQNATVDHDRGATAGSHGRKRTAELQTGREEHHRGTTHVTRRTALDVVPEVTVGQLNADLALQCDERLVVEAGAVEVDVATRGRGIVVRFAFTFALERASRGQLVNANRTEARRHGVEELTLLFGHDRGKHHDNEVALGHGTLPDDQFLSTLEFAGPTGAESGQGTHGELFDLSSARVGLDFERLREDLVGLAQVFANELDVRRTNLFRVELIDRQKRRDSRRGTLENEQVVSLTLRVHNPVAT
jgi:hypothetical protein